ncbi:hypothetical protein [Pseudomonas protegens]|uniref:hypothetical protein n=2 Tax=Pseudomonas protegens TaxID=380021 RepID=UPI0011CE99D2|nr:hypothetical protein [Pseudomonas protegens]
MPRPRMGYPQAARWRAGPLQPRLWLLVLCCSAAPSASAQDSLTLHSDLTVLSYATWNRLNQDALANPDNLIAQLPRRQMELAPRPDFSLTTSSCFFQFKPRAFLSARGESFATGDQHTSGDAYVNEARLSCSLPNALNLELGRGTLLWGNAVLLSPSNPFFPETGKTDPVNEVFGKDFARATLALAEHWQIEGMRSVSSNSRDMSAQHFSPISAVKLNWTAEAATASLLASKRDNGVRRLGAYGTLTVSDAWLLYLDGSLGQGRDIPLPVAPTAQTRAWHFEHQPMADRRLRKSLLLGSGYTLESGWTHTLEALYNGDGYSPSEREDYQRAIGQSNAALMLGDSNAAQVLGQALLTARQGLLGQRYAMYQIDRNDWFNTWDLALRYTQAFDSPRGGNLALSLNYKMNDHSELFTFAQWNTGNGQSEFAQLSRSSVISGIRYYF